MKNLPTSLLIALVISILAFLTGVYLRLDLWHWGWSLDLVDLFFIPLIGWTVWRYVLDRR